MPKPTYEVVACEAGAETLQGFLNSVPEDIDVVSILPNHGGALTSVLGDSSRTSGYLIVLRRSA